MHIPYRAFIFFSCFFLFALNAETAPTPSKKTINLGQSACFSGALGVYGNIIKNAITARINRINKQGGIHGHKVALVSLNDNSDPQRTYDNTKKLRAQNIDMFIGNMGTRSIIKLLPLIQEKKIAMFFPWSGDPLLNDPSLSHIINGQGLLGPQLTTIAQHVTTTLRMDKIALFHADDGFSTAAAETLIKILSEHHQTPIAVASYNRFTLDIITPAKTLINADPRVVICIATSMPTVKLINHFFAAGHYGTTFCGVDSTLFTPLLTKDRGVDYFYTSAVPHPKNATIPLAQNYKEDMKLYFPNEHINTLSFSYYVSAAIVLQAMQESQNPHYKEEVIKIIEAMDNTSIEGLPITFNHKNRHAFGSDISLITRKDS